MPLSAVQFCFMLSDRHYIPAHMGQHTNLSWKKENNNYNFPVFSCQKLLVTAINIFVCLILFDLVKYFESFARSLFFIPTLSCKTCFLSFRFLNTKICIKRNQIADFLFQNILIANCFPRCAITHLITDNVISFLDKRYIIFWASVYFPPQTISHFFSFSAFCF